MTSASLIAKQTKQVSPLLRRNTTMKVLLVIEEHVDFLQSFKENRFLQYSKDLKEELKVHQAKWSQISLCSYSNGGLVVDIHDDNGNQTK